MKILSENKLISKNVLIRLDLNVPVLNGVISEKSRIKSIKFTIKKLREQNNKVFIISHFGRPQGKKDEKYSLKFICPTLKEEFNLDKIFFLEKIEINKLKDVINKMSPKDVCLFENIRFSPEEEKNELFLVKKLSKYFDVFINDAFSSSHRNHASIVGFPKFLPAFAGYSFVNEIQNINSFFENLKKPNLAIIGGSKISTKIELLNNLVKKFDTIVIGGAMANTFLHVNKINIGNSLYEKNLVDVANSILKKSLQYNCKIILPVDVVCADNLKKKLNIKTCDVENISKNQMILDLGPKTTKLISTYILMSKMILWNGPLGAFEYKPFDKSSVDIANVIKDNAKNLNISVIAGGGDTISLIKLANAENGFTYISNAGGAFLEWLEGKESPGVLALKENKIN